LIGDTFLSVNAPVQIALPRLLDLAGGIREEITLRIRRNRETLEAALGPESPCRLLPPEGGWSAVVQVPSVRSEEEWVLSLLEEDGVLVHPGYFFDFPSPAYLVLSLLPREDLFRAGVERIQARAGFGENPGRA
jgi:alanine-synthesizing transaminase